MSEIVREEISVAHLNALVTLFIVATSVSLDSKARSSTRLNWRFAPVEPAGIVTVPA